MTEVIEGIFTVNLGVRERVLAFTDLIREDEVISSDERDRREALRKIAEICQTR
jgi:DnaJ-domain-containing protein 1